ncbi:sensor histidine kinase [Spirosoma oryzicola]|uniref:sensor histidine kinase n=1 Tax=Spirosoma oryzicola TaxID=2898794 RepID=UPI001E4E65DF|nr:HAMP domain-containing histidine kinase [Spirosoma oryzicola]UHG94912.1 HAMP domain-containing histidine kinase [Spirosoma oryzicola]
MRLLTRSTLISSAILLVALLISGLYIYDQVSQEVRDEIDEKLLNRKLEILVSLRSWERAIRPIPIATDFRLDSISAQDYNALNEHFEDISRYELVEGENELHRQLVTKFKRADTYYCLRIETSLLDLEDMGEIIAYSTLDVMVGLLLIAFLVNSLLQRKLWKPFYGTLLQLNAFRLDQVTPLQLPGSSIKEFNQLNETIAKLTAINQRVYQQQKQFVENASHEIQTPLAIALHQTEQLIQNPDLTANDAQALDILTQQLERLSAMNKALLLISKIDNQQFGETQSVNVGDLIRQTVDEYSFLAEQKSLRVELDFQNEIVVAANHHLMAMLVGNLIRNALVHSASESLITIQLADQSLRVENTAATPIAQPETLFGRFVKQSDKPQSLGLGLAIVKSICDTYQFTPSIASEGNQFIFSVSF